MTQYGMNLDPILHYKGRYNRDKFKNLCRDGSLWTSLDLNNPFDQAYEKIKKGDFIISWNDGISYLVVNVFRFSEKRVWVDFVPLLCLENFFYKGLYDCMVLEGYINEENAWNFNKIVD